MENNVSAILEGLNSEQRAAVTCVDGPVLIVAGAGSGKTRVLTSRIAYILENGCPPDRILALTFTKKAASEMKERIAMMVGQRKARRICMGTFHSVFIRFLREYAGFLGYPESFTIYDTSDSTSAIKTCIKELQLDDKVYKPKDVLSRISMAKNNLVTAESYRQNKTIQENDFRAKKPRISDIYLKYVQICRQNGVMDFDDILLNMNILLRDCPEAQEAISGRFDYIMVDEYQDTNLSQYLILRRLALPHSNLCVVGDDSQSIYAFRGAKIENILNFQKDYPTNHTFRLEQNYRSTRIIVDAANSLIAKNSARIPKRCFSEGDLGEKIKLIQAYTEQEEAILIANGIVSRIHSEHAQYQDFAILYRTNAQSRSLEEALRRRNLPYVIYSGNSFFERAEVKDMMAYFKLAVNVHDDESFKRVVNKPTRGIGETSILALVAAAQTNGCSLFKAAFRDDLESYGLKNAAAQKIRNFCQMMSNAATQVSGRDAHSLAVSISIDSGLYLHYKSDTSIEGQSRTANVEELLNSVKAYVEERHNEYYEDLLSDGQVSEGQELAESDFPIVTLSDYLENVSLLSAVDIEDEENGNNKITLMTVHSSKGLEYPYVYVAGMEENLFPSGGFSALPNDIEEERRLFYVAMTRAKKTLQLSFAQTRMRNGKHESNSPSRFVMEIDPQYVANPLSRASKIYDDDTPSSSWSRRGEASSSWRGRGEASSSWNRRSEASTARRVEVRGSLGSAASASAASFTPTPIVELGLGDRIEHNRFGMGKIIEISGPVTDRKAKIVFDVHGEKILLLKYAKIRKVDVAH